jgi:hypothetical protein
MDITHWAEVITSWGISSVSMRCLETNATNRYSFGMHGSEAVDHIHPAQVRDQWRALVNTVMNLHVP